MLFRCFNEEKQAQHLSNLLCFSTDSNLILIQEISPVREENPNMPYMSENQHPERPLASLATISLSKLAAGDAQEQQALLEASAGPGFFYLDLSGASTPSPTLVDDKDAVLDFMANYFAQPDSVKMLDDRRDSKNSKDHTVGYKPAGLFAGVAKGKRDAYESLKVMRAEMRSHSSALPSAVQQQASLFERYINGAQEATMTLLTSLSEAMHLPGPARLENSHREDQPTRTTLVMLNYPRQPDADSSPSKGEGHNKHTDIGSLTLLFSHEWGLQVLSPDEPDTWLWVEPRPNHAIINIGDSLRFLSGGRLNSCVHRVVPTPELRDENRYSLAYFLRAEDDATYTDSMGRTLTARQWHDNKYDVFTQDHSQQEKATVLTGGMERGEALIAVS